MAALFVAASSLSAGTVALKPLTVLSSTLQIDELSAPQSYEIYDSNDIAKTSVSTLYEFLNNYTSLNITPSYGNPLSQRIDMRGYGGNGYQNIVINIDGKRLNNIDMVPQLLSSIQPQSVERIEILQGSGSVLNGDGANAGVINIVTKKGNLKELTMYGGVYNTYGAQLNLSHTDELVSATASAQLYSTDGDRHIDSDQNRNKQRLTNGLLDIAVTPLDELEVRVGAAISRVQASYGGPMSLSELKENSTQPGSGYGWGPSPSEQKYDSDRFSGGATYDMGERVSLNLDLSTEDKTSNFLTYNSIYKYNYKTLRATIDYRGSLFALHGGFDMFDGARDAKASAYKNANETSKTNRALFAMLKTGFGAHTFKLGVRSEEVDYDYSDQNSSLEQSHRLSAVEFGANYRLSDKRSIFVSYAHSYQAPDVDRFFSGDGKSSKFNEFIDPMSADSFTVGFNHIDNTLKFKTKLYYTLLKDEIYYYADRSFVASTNTNIDNSTKYGLDIYTKWQADEFLALSFNYNYIIATIDDETYNGEKFSGNTLPGVSEHNLKMNIELQATQNTLLLLSQTYRSGAYALDDFNNSFENRQDAYYSTDLTINYTQDRVSYFATINNIFGNTNSVMVKEDVYYPTTHTTTAKAGVKIRF